MFNPFSSMADQLLSAGERPPEAAPTAERPTIEFVYDYPSVMLTSAIEAHREFNRKKRQCRSRIVCAMDIETRKVAVFPDLIVAFKALGYGSVGVLKNRTLAGGDLAKGLLLCSPDFNDTYISFNQPVTTAAKGTPAKRSGHLFSFNLQTGQQLLHPSIFAAVERLKLTKDAIQEVMLGAGKPQHRKMYRFEVATLASIHAFDPDYCPTHFKNQVAKTTDVLSYINGSFEPEWGLSNRGSQIYPVPSWRSAKRKAGLIS